MDALGEWRFSFSVSSTEPIPEQLMDSLLLGIAIPWAEQHELGIGGGFRPAAGTQEDAVRRWNFRFGLCITRAGQQIPRHQARELLDLLRCWCQERGLMLAGGFGPFSEEESDATNIDVSGGQP
jgi:hypothetical protein